MLNCSRLARLLLIALCLGAVVAPRAEQVPELNVARLPVDDRSASALAGARRAGLAEVIVRLTGQRTALDHPVVVEALRSAQRYLVQYSYREDDDSLALRMEYDADALRELLRNIRLPVWTANRPPVLVWLVTSDGLRRQFASNEELPALNSALREDFQRRGVPLRLPLYDLEDRAALPLGVAWRQNSSALVAASARYGDLELLAGRVARFSDGRWIGDWQFLDSGRWRRVPVEADSMAAFSAAGADLAARSLAERYAVVGDATDERLRITVLNIPDFETYRRVRDQLAALEPIDRVVPERVAAGMIVLRVESAARLEQLARIVELDTRFARVVAPLTDADLTYQWRE